MNSNNLTEEFRIQSAANLTPNLAKLKQNWTIKMCFAQVETAANALMLSGEGARHEKEIAENH